MARRSARVRLGRIRAKKQLVLAVQGEQAEWPELPGRRDGCSTDVLGCASSMDFAVYVISLSGEQLLVTRCDEHTTLRELRVRLSEAGVPEAFSAKFLLGDAVLAARSTLLSPYASDGGSITVQLVIVRNLLRFDGLYSEPAKDSARGRETNLYFRFYEEGQAVIAIACSGRPYPGAVRDAWRWAYRSTTGQLVRVSSSVDWIAHGGYEIHGDTLTFDLTDEAGKSARFECLLTEGSMEIPALDRRFTFLPLDDMDYYCARRERPGCEGRVHVTYHERSM